MLPPKHAEKFQQSIANSQQILLNNCGHIPQSTTKSSLFPDAKLLA
jgi:hypothetical protein